jgi:hypothetical protein
MSSIFGHDLAAVYRDRAYALRPRGSWVAIGVAFAVGAGAAIAVMKMPASSSGEPTPAVASQTVSKPGMPPAQGAAGKSETGAKAPIRVIAPEVVPPPPNVTTAVTREAPRPPPKTGAADTSAVTDPNMGAAPREQVVDATPAGIVPVPPPKPAELRASAANQSTPNSPALPPAAAASLAPNGGGAIAPPPASATAALEPQPQEFHAKPTREQTKAARREAKRMEREERRRWAQERSRALQERLEAEGLSPADGDRARDGRRYTVYRRYDDDRSRAMAYGDDYRPARRGFFGLFDFD